MCAFWPWNKHHQLVNKCDSFGLEENSTMTRLSRCPDAHQLPIPHFRHLFGVFHHISPLKSMDFRHLKPSHWDITKNAWTFLRLHLGIGALQSGAIGAFFLPNLAAYVVGFGDFRDGNEPLKKDEKKTASQVYTWVLFDSWTNPVWRYVLLPPFYLWGGSTILYTIGFWILER